MRRRSRGSAADDSSEGAERPRLDAHATALRWLSQRELSAAQVQQRLEHRGVSKDDANTVVARLVAGRVIDDVRMARAAARLETAIRGRGPARARQKLLSLGLAAATVDDALASALSEVDVQVLLDNAVERRLRREASPTLDRAAFRRVAGALVRQGFAPADVMARLRARRALGVDDID